MEPCFWLECLMLLFATCMLLEILSATSIGKKYLFIKRLCCDLNGTAIVADSTGASKLRDHLLETLSKNIGGKVYVYQTQFLFLPRRLMDFNYRKRGELTHAEFCRTYGPDHSVDIGLFFNDTFYSSYIPKEMWKTHLHKVTASCSFMQQAKMNYFADAIFGNATETSHYEKFMPSFAKILCKNDYQLTFHTFGNDGSLLTHLLHGKNIIQAYVEQDASYSVVVPINSTFKKQKFSPNQFWDFVNDFGNYIVVVQESYERWIKHNKSRLYGKRAQAFWGTQWYPKIVSTLALDDVRCWDFAPKYLSGCAFFQVNTVAAFYNLDYFQNALESHFPSIFRCWITWLYSTFAVISGLAMRTIFLQLIGFEVWWTGLVLWTGLVWFMYFLVFIVEA